MRFQGRLYRALNPVYARQPLSGQGAALYGGRFNPRGIPALYTALSVMTALREANQVGHLQPTTLVAYDADITGVFDSRDTQALAAVGMDADALAAPDWRDEMRDHGAARTQRLARQLIAQGYPGLIVRSFAPGAGPGDLNLVLWTWGDAAPCRLVLIDDDNRLG